MESNINLRWLLELKPFRFASLRLRRMLHILALTHSAIETSTRLSICMIIIITTTSSLAACAIAYRGHQRLTRGKSCLCAGSQHSSCRRGWRSFCVSLQQQTCGQVRSFLFYRTCGGDAGRCSRLLRRRWWWGPSRRMSARVAQPCQVDDHSWNELFIIQSVLTSTIQHFARRRCVQLKRKWTWVDRNCRQGCLLL